LTTAESQEPTKDEALLTSVAESIGTTLGSLAARATAVQKAFTRKPKAKKRAAKKAKKKVAPKKKKASKPAKAAKSKKKKKK
jgi:hypothetical protein